MVVSKEFVSEAATCRTFKKYLGKRSPFKQKLRKISKNTYFPKCALCALFRLVYGLVFFLQGYWRTWISVGEKLSIIEIAYLLLSFLWDLKIQNLIIITCSKATKHMIVLFLSWSKLIWSHFSKINSQFTEVTLQRCS